MSEYFFYVDVCFLLYQQRLCSARELMEAIEDLPINKSKIYMLNFLKHPPESFKEKTFSYSPISDHSEETVAYWDPDDSFSVE